MDRKIPNQEIINKNNYKEPKEIMDIEQHWFIDKTVQQAQYLNVVNNALIPCQVKDLCRYIASKATWRHTGGGSKSYKPCFASQDTIQIQMGRSRKYVTEAKKKALELGWVQVRHRPGTSDQIYPRIGTDDPTIIPKGKRDYWAREDIKSLESD
jgi:hypothetical protein